MKTLQALAGGSALLAMAAGCAPVANGGPSNAPDALVPAVFASQPAARPGVCFASQSSPAVVETVTEQTLATPERRDASGRIVAPASYRSASHQRIVSARSEIWFQTPCPGVMTPDLVATLQRALAARGAYAGPATGVMSPATQAAVEAWQTARGLPSPTLATRAAQMLGVLPWLDGA